MSLAALLGRERIIAPPDYNRWLVPPAALAIHLAIGQVYAFSVFKVPLTRIIGIDHSAPGDWSQPTLAWIFSIAIVFLGLSAAVFGKWLEKAGPRQAMFASACCFGGGFLLSALGIYLHRIWLLYLGYGMVGGIGLGLGYISPVSTLLKWFPDRPGLATGLAIMGFGGGAMIGSPLANILMNFYRGGASNGVLETFLTMGGIYFAFMLFGALTVRLPPPGWRPAGLAPPCSGARQIARANILADEALRTPQFYLLWAVLFLNVTAGIGILEQAAPMIQELFGSQVAPVAAAAFVGLLSLFNMAGRFFWSALSDHLGRRPTYTVFFVLGAGLYLLIPVAGRVQSPALFIAVCAVIMSKYGGGFATIPAYLRDLFGLVQVGAIHGRLLTAWSCAGVVGPVLVNYIREYQIRAGAPQEQAYNSSMQIMAGLLGVGAVCNFLVTEVCQRHHLVGGMAPGPAVAPVKVAAEIAVPNAAPGADGRGRGQRAQLVLSWCWVGAPLAWGVWQTFDKALDLFR